VLPMADDLGPSISRFRYPSWASRRWLRRGLQGIRSSRGSPHLSGTLLWCHRRARGGGVQQRRLLHRSFGATICHLAGVKLPALFFFLVAADGVGIVADWRVDRAHLPLPPDVC
jgi:hypothetical protein